MAADARNDAADVTRDSAGGMAHGFRALRMPNYRLYWFGQLVSITGTWMQTTGQAWLVLTMTNSPLAIGVVTALQWLPVMLLSLVGGVIVDRVSRYRLIMATQVAAMALALVFGALVVLGVVQLWHVYVLALLQGLVNSVDTPARQAFSVELVEHEDVVSAVALNAVLFNAARIVGPAGAGLLIAVIGIGPVLLANAFSFLAPIWALLAMDRSKLRQRSKLADGSIIMRLREGLRYTWRTPDVLLIMIVVASIGTFGYNFSVTIPLIAGFVLRTDAVGFGGLMTALGVGSLAAALAMAYAKHVTERRLLIASGAFGVLLAAVALSPSYIVSVVLLAALGFAGVSFGTSANSLLQMKVPTELRGRVVSLYFLLFAGTTPIGGLLIGASSDAFGVPTALLLCAALCVVGVAVAVVYRGRLAIDD